VSIHPTLATLAALAFGALPLTAIATNDLDGRYDVGGRSIHLKCEGTGAPVVVIDAGLGTAPAGDPGWLGIAGKIAPVTRVCLYDRAGLGSSDPAPSRPRTSKDAATDLHAALKAAHVDGPYLLVGHSIGGLHAQVFASLYPDDTAGLVLVSSTHPDQSKAWLAALGPAKAGEEKAATEARTFIGTVQTNPAKNEEGLDITQSTAQARQLHTLGAKPIIVATHSPRFRMVPGLSEPMSIKLEGETQRLQKQFLSLSTNAHQNIAATAGHGLPHEDPAFVVANILQGVAAVRGIAAPAEPKATSGASTPRPSYDACLQQANTTADMVGCANDEYAFQDKRLNDVYKTLMSTLPTAEKTTLRAEERQWVGDKTRRCKPPRDGGTLAVVEASGCAVEETAKRAAVLEKRLPPASR